MLAACGERLASAPHDHDTLIAVLIEVGEIDAALADALFPNADDRHPLAEAAHAATRALARRLAGHTAPPQPALEALLAHPLPATVTLRVPEGYAWYALHPEAYLRAARTFGRDARPARAVVIGLRSIGTSLAAMVAAGLEAEGVTVDSLSLRPRGHPFDRRPALSPALAEYLRSRAAAHFLIVDEGPGLSGSSLTGTAAALADLGIPDPRIILVPAWLPAPATFRSALARERWPRHAKLALPEAHPFPAHEDWSGGLWRHHLYARDADWPAVQPQHERRKFLGPDGILRKFAGLGRYGEARLTLAQRLAGAGFTPPVQSLSQGYLEHTFIPGRPLTAAGTGPAFLAHAARYLSFRARYLATGEPARAAGLLPLIAVNLGKTGLERAAAWEAPAVAIDGRVQPHEWLATADGFLKTDAIDHHDDHFLPGPQPILWDVAGLAVEFALPPASARDLAQAVAPDQAAHLPFVILAYRAARLGYATLAAETLGACADGTRMAVEAWRHRDRRSKKERLNTLS